MADQKAFNCVTWLTKLVSKYNIGAILEDFGVDPSTIDNTLQDLLTNEQSRAKIFGHYLPIATAQDPRAAKIAGHLRHLFVMSPIEREELVEYLLGKLDIAATRALELKDFIEHNKADLPNDLRTLCAYACIFTAPPHPPSDKAPVADQ